jgi:hypothetical protein
MSMVAAEAAAGRTAATREGLVSTPRSGARPLGGSDPGPGERQSAPRSAGPSGPRGPSGPPGRTAAAPRPAPKRSGPSAGQAVRASRQFKGGEFREYQGIILAEFILAELLVSATPIATRQNMPGLSPYIPRDMTKMLAIGLVYFLLELGAVGGHTMGRFGAWFGGLILLTVGLNEAANITKDLDLFAGFNPKSTSKQATGTTQAPGTTTAGGRG